MIRRLLLIGDVGDDVYHVGDEAMFETAVAEIVARRDVHVTAVASRPEIVAARYGVTGVPQLGFDRRVGSAHDADREQRLEAVLDGTATDPAAVSLRAAVDAAEGVVVCGGGNLSASWPHLLYERLAVLALARRRGIPTVLVGQTIGPELTDRPAARLAEALATAALVGVRDLPSAALARELAPGAAVLLHQDDAAHMPSASLPAGLPDQYVALAMHGNADDDLLVERCVDLIGHLHHLTDLPVVLVPHTGTLQGDPSPGTDAALVATLAKGHPDATWLHPCPVLESGRSAAVLRHASAVVSARFHPLVFALSAGVPAIGLSTDRYTDIKLAGALAHHGVSEWRLPLHTLGTGAAEALIDELWQRRDEIRRHITDGDDERRARHVARWDLVARCLDGAPTSSADIEAAPLLPELAPREVATGVIHAWDQRSHSLLREYAIRADRSEEYALSLRAELDRVIEAREHERLAAEREQAILAAAVAAAHDEVKAAHASADAARDLAGRLRATLDRGPVAPPPSDDAVALQRELDALRRTKTFRWSAPARQFYSRLRTSGSRRRS